MQFKILFIWLFLLFFTELLAHQISLEEAIDIALKNNYLITQSKDRIMTAQANVISAKSTKRTKLNFNTTSVRYNQELANEWSFPKSIDIPPLIYTASLNILGVSVPFTINIPSTKIALPQPENIYYSKNITYSMNLSLKQAIYTFGKLEGLIYQAKKSKEIAELEFEKAKRDVILNTKVAYYNFLKTKSLYNLVNEALKHAQAHLKDAELRFKLGKVAEFGVVKAKINLENIKSELISALKQKIKLEVKSVYFRLINAKQKVDILLKNIDQAKTALNIANIRYNRGLSTRIEVLDAQFLLNKTKANYIQAIYDYKIAEAELQHAIGGKIETID